MPNAQPGPNRKDPTDRNIGVGDRVAYSHRFLQSISSYTGDMPHARGRVTALVPVGRELTLAEVEWDRGELPPRVNVKNLCRVGDAAFHD